MILTKRFCTLLCLMFFTVAAAYGMDKINIDSDSMKILQKGEVVEFAGNVVVRAPEMTATAERAVMDRSGETVNAHGNVEVHYSSGALDFTAWCGKLLFSRRQQYVRMYNDVKAVYEPGITSTSTVVFSDRSSVDFASGRQQVRFEGNVRASRGNVEVRSQLAEYDRNRELFIFSLNPRAFSDMEQAFTEYSGDKIIFSLTSEEVSMSGKAKTRIKLQDDIGM